MASTIYTDVAPTIVDGPTTLESALILGLARIGLRVTALKIDSAVAPSVSRDPSAWRVAATSNRLLMTLDTLMGTTTAGGFQSLGQLAALVDHLDLAGAATLDDLAISLITSVSASGRGCGEGAHCLIGNNTMLTALAKTATAKANGSCGWRLDPRTGLTVYHFLGVPFYRCDIAEDEGHFLFSANLGATGLRLTMVHGYGTAETYGLEVDQEPVHPAIASRDMNVRRLRARDVGPWLTLRLQRNLALTARRAGAGRYGSSDAMVRSTCGTARSKTSASPPASTT
ncbi:MAG: hypothetical protein R3A48_19120 [Polyangiales bacterium]